MFKTATIAYLPAPSDARFHTTAFLRNLKANPAAGDLLLFSDHAQPDWPNVITLGGPMERDSLKDARIQNPITGAVVANRAAINNLVFLTALRMIEKHGYSHFIYLEEDCRVAGPGWDSAVLAEFFNYPRHLLAGGSIMAFNVANHTMASLQRWEQFLDETKAYGRKFPIPPYGYLSAADGRGSNIFINGAGGVYSVAALKLLFPERNNPITKDTELARKMWAWDFEIGLRAWSQFGPDVYNVLGPLPSVFSGYGNILSTEEERLAMLGYGFRIVHQIKSDK